MLNGLKQAAGISHGSGTSVHSVYWQQPQAYVNHVMVHHIDVVHHMPFMYS